MGSMNRAGRDRSSPSLIPGRALGMGALCLVIRLSPEKRQNLYSFPTEMPGAFLPGQVSEKGAAESC